MKGLLFVLMSLVAAVPVAYGQDDGFPNKPIRIIVPFTPGSSADTASRFFGSQMADKLGQPFIVENRPGGSGAIAMSAVKNAAADGYTLFLASNSLMSVNPLVIKSLPYDPGQELKPIGGLTRGVNVLIVSAQSKYRTLGELIDAGKKGQGLNGGTYSWGYRLAAEWLANLSGMKLTNISYKGAAQVLTDTASGQLDFAVVSLDGAASMIRSGQVRALAISDERRHKEFPDVPTIKESGYPEYVNYSWDSLYVMNQTPQAAVDKLAGTLQEVLATDESRAFVEKAGRQLMPYAPEAMHQYQVSELKRFRGIMQAAGIQPE